jgi:hypothetical protein
MPFERMAKTELEPSNLAGNKLDVMCGVMSLTSVSPLIAVNVHTLSTVMLWVVRQGLYT